MKKAQTISAIIINGFIFLSIFIIILILTRPGTYGPEKNSIKETFKFFTNLSNIYCALTCLAAMIAEIRIVKGKQKDIPHWLLVLRQTGTTAVALTFFTVMFFLAPISGKEWMSLYHNTVFFLHFLDPLLAMICFIFLEKGKLLSMKENLLSLIPVIAYEVVYTANVIFFRNWDDFYGFTFGGISWAPFVMIPVMAGVTFLLSFMLSSLQKRNSDKHRQK